MASLYKECNLKTEDTMIYLYGASFDPITVAHQAIINQVIQYVRGEYDCLQVLVSNNDSKKYTTPLEHRLFMVRQAIPELPRVSVRVQEQRTMQYIQENVSPFEDVTIVVGEDQMDSILRGEWRNHDLLLQKYKFLVITRNDFGKANKQYPPNVTQRQIIGTQGISSSIVRNIYYKNPSAEYDGFLANCLDVQTFRYIKKHGLYNQNTETYPEELNAFLNEYEGKKFKNAIRTIMAVLQAECHCDDIAVNKVLEAADKAYGEPSVTTDIIAHTDNDYILLIRRKKNPYKNYWALPGGFFEKTDTDLCYGAARELQEETTLNLDPKSFVQVKAYGHNFDPRMKIVDVAFSVKVSQADMGKALGDDDAAEACWFHIHNLPPLAFHHRQIIDDWKESLTP